MTEPQRVLGNYQLVSQLAVGGMAEIYVARAGGVSGFEKLFALKLIHPNYSSDPEFVQMLVDEAKLAVQLQHSNIVQTFDLGKVDEQYYIAMELIDGVDLYKLLRTASDRDLPFPIEVACFIAHETCAGLDYAHTKTDGTGQPLQIVHRDVSPQNVLVTHDGQVKIVDFGIAKAAMRSQKTAAGVIKGKYYYMSPEQAWGDKIDARTDVFSTGILLYEMLIGQMLYLEQDVDKLLTLVRKAEIPPPSQHRKDVPPELDRIVMKALAKRPEDRYASAGDFAAALSRFLYTFTPDFTRANVSGLVKRVLGDMTPPKARHSHAVTTANARADVGDDEHSLLFQLPPQLGTTPAHARARDVKDSTKTVDAPKTPAPKPAAAAVDYPDEATIIDGQQPFPVMETSAERTAVDVKTADRLEDTKTRTMIREPSQVGAVVDMLTPTPSPSQAATLMLNVPTETTNTVDTETRSTPGMEPTVTPTLGRTHWPNQPSAQTSASGAFPYGSPLREELPTDISQRREARPWLWLVGLAALFGAVTVALVILLPGPPRPGSVEIVSTPSGAEVRLDGTLVERTTPLRITDVDPSRPHHLSVSLAGHDTWETDVKFEDSARSVRLQAILVPLLGTLHVESTPPGAEVIVNGRIYGLTPLDVPDLATNQDATLELRLRGYKVARQTLSWKGARKLTSTIALSKAK